MDLGLRGKTALVCGASSGLGRAIAEEFAAEGADLAICARSEGALEQAAAAIAKRRGVRVIPVAADLTQQAEIDRLVRRAQEDLGRIDILVSNTGGPPPGPFEAHDREAWSRAVDLLLHSAVELARLTLPGMKERKWGRIINVTSVAVKQPVYELILSNSVRAAVTGMARTLADQAGRDGVTVNNVMPGYTNTERLEQLAKNISERDGVSVEEVYERWANNTAVGRIAEPEDLAALVAFLASDRARMITGASIAVDGGSIKSLL